MQYSEMQLLQRMRYNAYCDARILNTMPWLPWAPARVPGLGIKGVPAALQKHTATVQC